MSRGTWWLLVLCAFGAFVAFFLLALSHIAGAASPPRPTQGEVDRLIDQLGDDSFDNRQLAMARLRTLHLVTDISAALDKGKQSGDLEIRKRCQRLAILCPSWDGGFARELLSGRWATYWQDGQVSQWSKTTFAADGSLREVYGEGSDALTWSGTWKLSGNRLKIKEHSHSNTGMWYEWEVELVRNDQGEVFGSAETYRSFKSTTPGRVTYLMQRLLP